MSPLLKMELPEDVEVLRLEALTHAEAVLGLVVVRFKLLLAVGGVAATKYWRVSKVRAGPTTPAALAVGGEADAFMV